MGCLQREEEWGGEVNFEWPQGRVAQVQGGHPEREAAAPKVVGRCAPRLALM